MNNAHDENISFCPASEGSAQHHVSMDIKAREGFVVVYHLGRHLRPGDLNLDISTRNSRSAGGTRTKEIYEQTRRHIGADV